MMLDVARQFDPYPFGRDQGRDFRRRLLLPMLREIMQQNGDTLVIDIDGCRALGSSFLEEAFGGLIRYEKIPRKDVQRHIKFHATKPGKAFFADVAREYIREARPET